MNAIAEQHAALSTRFAELAAGVGDWDVPTPVKEWTARDIVTHLATWLPGLLSSCGLEFMAIDTDGDPNDVWAAHSARVQAFVADDAVLQQMVKTYSGQKSVGEVFEAFYLSDIFLHQYDLAKASGQPVGWNDDVVEGIVAAMTPQVDYLRESGEFGDPVILDASHPAEERLAALIGRDPLWRS